MLLIGDRVWRTPAWLDRILPRRARGPPQDRGGEGADARSRSSLVLVPLGARLAAAVAAAAEVRPAPNTSPSWRRSASPTPKRPSARSAAPAPTFAPNGFRVAGRQVRQGEADLRRHRPADLARRRGPRPIAAPSRDGSPPCEREDAATSARSPPPCAAEDVARFQRVWADFIHEGNQANNVVVSFGFDYCTFKPSRFQ